MQVILLKETFWESAARDATSVIAVLLMVGIGVWLESPAMQWVGAMLAFTSIMGRTSSFRKECTLTVQEAREKLDEIEKSEVAE